MIQIRRGLFETNSSSVHAITVCKELPDVDYIYKRISFSVGEFGWEHVTYYDTGCKAKYLWTAIVNLFMLYEDEHTKFCKDNPTYLEIKSAIINTLLKLGFEEEDIEFQEEFEENKYGWIDSGYIDHAPGLDFIKELVFNEDRLIRYLFNEKSTITTWNDNEWDYEEDDSKHFPTLTDPEWQYMKYN